MNKNVIFIVTSSGDVHTDYLTEKLDRDGVPFYRFHSESLLIDRSISFLCESNDISWEFLRYGEKLIPLKEISAIFFRKPKPVRTPPSVSNDARMFCEWEGRYFVDAFLNHLHTLPDVKWVNDDRKIRVAEDKPAQLSRARQYGFMIPDTLITIDPMRAYEFYRRHQVVGRGVVVKVFIARGLPPSVVSYTHLLEPDLTPKDFEGTRGTLTFLQEFIPKRFDIRAVCVGKRLFAVRIDSQEYTGSQIDFRAIDMRQLRHSPYCLPASLAERIFKLVQSFGLVHAEIDMCVNEKGEHVFFEMNPNGQWLWLELLTGLPIADSFIAELITPNK